MFFILDEILIKESTLVGHIDVVFEGVNHEEFGD